MRHGNCRLLCFLGDSSRFVCWHLCGGLSNGMLCCHGNIPISQEPYDSPQLSITCIAKFQPGSRLWNYHELAWVPSLDVSDSDGIRFRGGFLPTCSHRPNQPKTNNCKNLGPADFLLIWDIPWTYSHEIPMKLHEIPMEPPYFLFWMPRFTTLQASMYRSSPFSAETFLPRAVRSWRAPLVKVVSAFENGLYTPNLWLFQQGYYGIMMDNDDESCTSDSPIDVDSSSLVLTCG